MLKIKKEVLTAIARRQELSAIIDAATKQKNALNETIMKEWTRLGGETFQAEVEYELEGEPVRELVAVRVQAGRVTKSISEDRLMEKGVSVDVIKYARVEKEGDPFVVVSKVKEKGAVVE